MADRCGDCKHWGGPDDDGDYRKCGAIVHDRHGCSSRCFDDVYEHSLVHEVPRERVAEVAAFRDRYAAVTIDHERYKSEVRTREDFGCVLFEAKG